MCVYKKCYTIELNMWFSTQNHNTLTHTAVKYRAALRLLSSAQALNYKGGDGLRLRAREREKMRLQRMQNEFKHPSNITKHKQLETNVSLTWSDVNKWMKWQWTGRTSARVTDCHLNAAGLQTADMQHCTNANTHIHVLPSTGQTETLQAADDSTSHKPPRKINANSILEIFQCWMNYIFNIRHHGLQP